MESAAKRDSTRNRLIRLLAVGGLGGTVHVLALWLGRWTAHRHADQITAGCTDTDCQPQYYIGVTLGYFFVTLPTAYIVGWVAIVWIASLTAKRSGSRLVARLVVACLVTTGVLIGYSGFLTTLPEGDRWRLWMGAIAITPVVVSGLIAYLTTVPDRINSPSSR